MPVRIVQSKQNPRLKQLKRALAQPLRETDSCGRALAGIEGPNLLEEAVRAGLHIDCVFAAEGSEYLLDSLLLSPGTEVLLLPRELLDSILTTEAPQPVAALVSPRTWSWDELLSGMKPAAPLIVVLAGLQDPGNVGAILRSAEAFGASGVVSLPGTVSAWNPKAVRGSAGSVFRVPLFAVSPEECFGKLREAGVRVLTAAMDGAELAHRVHLSGPVAILIGNEGNGVPPELAAQADGAIAINMPGPVESLNAAVAAGVLLYEAARQRAGV